MGKIRIMLIIPVLFLAFYTQTVFAQVSGMPDGCTYILMDLKTGQVIAQQDADKKVRPASTTKVMTAILALENGRLDQIMDVSKSAVYDIGDGGSNIGINPGESNLTLETS
jgi:D-alanyl-D-alanine carboxypeptidase